MGRGIVLLLLLFALPAHGASVRIIDDFEMGLDPHWEVKKFAGETHYEVVREGSSQVLRAVSHGAASALIYHLEYDLHAYPLLHWRWKVAGVLATGDATRKSGDDYAARVYVIFPHWFPPKSRSINYLWANRLPQGEFLPSAFFGNSVMLAVESGPDKAGEWVAEERNVLEDYRRIFGEEPPPVGAIAIMTDTDQTGESVTAWYDDIGISATRLGARGSGLGEMH